MKKSVQVAVYDGSSLFLGRLEDSEFTKFRFIPKEEYQKTKDNLRNSKYYALLVVSPNFLTTNTVQMISGSNIPFDLKSQIKNKFQTVIEKDKMAEVVKQTAIPDLEDRIKATRIHVNIDTIKLGEGGETRKSSTEIGMILGYIFGFMIYMFIFIYGTMVMQGVMEEKQSRIVEVIISSVKPFQLMMGKIVGIAMVGLTQFAIWVILGFHNSFGFEKFLSWPHPGSAITKCNDAKSGCNATGRDSSNGQNAGGLFNDRHYKFPIDYWLFYLLFYRRLPAL